MVCCIALTIALLLKLKPVSMLGADGTSLEETIVPDGLLHPRFERKRSGPGMYITADRYVFQQLVKKRTQKHD